MSKQQPNTEISEEERALFRDSVDKTRRLKPDGRHRKKPSRPSTRPLSRQRDEQAVMEELLDHPLEPEELATGDELEYRQSGVQHAVMRKLRRGQYTVDKELDLHGMTVAMARPVFVEFLQEAQRQNWRCVRIIHGKGLRSGHRGPVLKRKVAVWLKRRQEVLAYCSAKPQDGGHGAVYVLLQKP